MAERKPSGVKEYDGKPNKGPFQTVEKCQEFAARVFEYTAKAEKEYRVTLCKQVQEYCLEIVHLARLANETPLQDPLRRETHDKVLEYMSRVNDLLPILRRLRCMSPNQESDLHKKFSSLKFGYKKWVESDERRLEKISDG